MSRMEKAFALFDAYNRQDPHILTMEGIAYPAEYFYAQQCWHWVRRLQPDAGETLLLASRCQHIGRWEIPRSAYPAGKAGYYSWRTGLAKFHADKAGGILTGIGYDAVTTDAVRSILLKEDLRNNPDMQVMENALCLVFLQFQYEDFGRQQEEEKMIRILKKTWAKMSQPGRDAALTLPFSAKGKELIGKALQG
ncbi:MAG TPA: DUF4202 domain-containing protein [Puia sp.]|nr:DUF4202 domain-containing protein [Puia sp.]